MIRRLLHWFAHLFGWNYVKCESRWLGSGMYEGHHIKILETYTVCSCGRKRLLATKVVRDDGEEVWSDRAMGKGS